MAFIEILRLRLVCIRGHECEEGEEGCGAGGQRKSYLIAAGVEGLAFHLLPQRSPLSPHKPRQPQRKGESEAENSRVYADRPQLRVALQPS